MPQPANNMATCTKLSCCLPDPFGINDECPTTRYTNSRLILSCAAGSYGDSVVIEAGQYESLTSQTEADLIALRQATSIRNLSPCKFYNTEQTYTATCDDLITTASSTVPARSLSSITGQADADAAALALATTQAQEALVCP